MFACALCECEMHLNERMRHSFMLPQPVHSVLVKPNSKQDSVSVGGKDDYGVL